MRAPARRLAPGRRLCRGGRRRFPPRTLALAALCAVILGCGGAAAQTPTRDKPFPEIRNPRRWGPFLVDPRFVIDNIGYDNNIFLTPDVSSTAPVGDVVIRAGPEIQAQSSLSRRLMLTLRDKLAGEAFLQHADINSWNNEFEGQLDFLLGPVLFTTKGRWLSQYWRPSSEITARVREDDESLAEIVRFFIGPKTDIGVGVERLRLRYREPNTFYLINVGTVDDPQFELVTIDAALDRDETTTGGEIGWRPRSRTRFFVRYEEVDSTFASAEVRRDSTQKTEYLGLEFSPSSRLSGRFAWGQSKLAANDPSTGQTPYDGPVALTQLVYRPGGTTRVTARWEKQVYFSTFGSNLYYQDNFRSLGLDTYLGVAWGLTGGYSLRDNDYPEPSIALGGEHRHDRVKNYYGGLLFRLKGGFEIGIRYGRETRDSNDIFAVTDQHYLTTSGSYVF